MTTRPLHTYFSIPTAWAGFTQVPDTYAAPPDAPTVDPIGQPYISLSPHGSAYLGHLMWEPGKTIGTKEKEEVEILATEATANFNLLLDLAERVDHARQPLDLASAGLHQALRGIARKADDDLLLLHVFSKWCSSKEEGESQQLLDLVFTALGDLAALDRRSPEYRLLESLASFGVKRARFGFREILWGKDQGVNFMQPSWRDHLSVTVPLRGEIARDPSLIEASIRKGDVDRVRDAEARLVAAVLEGERSEIVSALAEACPIDANREADFMAQDIVQWLERIKTFSRSGKETIIRIEHPLPGGNFEVPIEPYEIIIYAIEQRAELSTLKKGLRNLARLAPTSPDALRYLVLFGKLDADYIPEYELEQWDEKALTKLFEGNPTIFEDLDFLATFVGYTKPRRALAAADTRTVKRNWVASGLPVETFIDVVLPTLIQMDNESALHFLWERDGIDPHVDRIIPFKKPDGSE